MVKGKLVFATDHTGSVIVTRVFLNEVRANEYRDYLYDLYEGLPHKGESEKVIDKVFMSDIEVDTSD